MKVIVTLDIVDEGLNSINIFIQQITKSKALYSGTFIYIL